MYLIRWMVYGVTLVLRDIMFVLFINTSYMLMEPVKQLIAYIVVELIYYGVAILVMWLVIKLIHKVYVNKKEDISGKELILLFATLLTVMVGYFTFNFFSNVYVEDTGNYVWNVHPGYTFLRGDISDCFFCCYTYRSYYISEDKGKTARGKCEFAIGRADRKHETAHQ